MEKVILSTEAPGGIDSKLDPRFGRCAFFTVVEIDKGRIDSVQVEQNTGATAGGGAGIQAAQIILNLGADAIITGNLGPNAASALSQTQIKKFKGIIGSSVKDNVDKYLINELKEMPGANVASHAGMGMGRGGGGGGGRGGGMGRGR